MADDNLEKAAPTNINITSHNQIGGITAHTAHLGPAQRSLNTELEADLLTLPKEKPIRIIAAQDSEACAFAYQIHGFIKANGFSMKEPNGITRILNPKPGMQKLAFYANNGQDGKDEYHLIVGQNL